MADEFTIHIYPSDCDAGGHVNHTYMLALLERARWAALERHMTFEEYVKRALVAVVRHIEASYTVPARAGDDFIIRTGLLSVGSTSFHRQADSAQSTGRRRFAKRRSCM